jgi:hypothetical protein
MNNMDKLNRDITEAVNTAISEDPWLRKMMTEVNKADIKRRRESGAPRIYDLKQGQKMYLWYPMVGRTKYCYTPHPDTNGDYWYFNEVRTYKAHNPKLGQLAEQWKRTKYVKCARRKTAINGALRRYRAAIKAQTKRSKAA